MKYLLIFFLLAPFTAEAALRQWLTKSCEYILDPGMLKPDTRRTFAEMDMRLKNRQFNWSNLLEAVGTRNFFPTAKVAFANEARSEEKFVGNIVIRIYRGRLHFYQVIDGATHELPFYGQKMAQFIIRDEPFVDSDGTRADSDLIRFMTAEGYEFYFYFLRAQPTVIAELRVGAYKKRTLFILDGSTFHSKAKQ